MYNRNKQAPTLIDTPTPKCFPNWMRRLNPYFKREDTNAFFETQVRVKKVYRNEKPALISFLFSIMTFILLLFAWCFAFWKLIIFIFIYQYLISFFLVKRPKPVKLQNQINEDEFLNYASETLLMDLWLCGIGGKQILEGLILLLRQLIRLHIVYPLHGSNFQLFVAAFV